MTFRHYNTTLILQTTRKRKGTDKTFQAFFTTSRDNLKNQRHTYLL